MATQVQFRRGTAAQNAAFTGVEGEVSYSTDQKRLITHDGSTVGGERQAKLSEVELVANKSIDGTLAANSDTLYPSQKAVKTYADAISAAATAGLALKENTANKSNDGTLAANSPTLFPTQQAVKTYADAISAASAAGLALKVSKSGDTMSGTLVMTPSVANTSALTSSGQSVTGANVTPLFDLAATWNTSGAPSAFKINVTDTASAATGNLTGPFLLNLQKNGVTRFGFSKDGTGEFLRQEADTAQGGLEMYKRGTTGDANAALSSGSGIASLGWDGWDGAAYGSAGHIRMFTSEAWTGIAHGSKLFFSTVAAGATATTVSATLDNTALEVFSRLLLPNTTSATVGGVYFGGSRAFHNFGTNNTFAGVLAGNLTLTGTQNSVFGASAGTVLTSGTNNSFFGRNAGGANTTGGYNSFFGRLAGASNIAGGYNAFFGMNAGTASTASNNAFFGASSGASNTSGTNNSFFGFGSGVTNITGSTNAFFGTNAGTLSTVSNNAFFGAFSGDANTTGTNNSFFGSDSGGANVGGGGNSFFGRQAGLQNTTGSTNSFFGSLAGDNLTAGSNNIVIGAAIDVPSSTGSNLLTIGNLIFGTGIDGVALGISTGNIGIAVITPTSGLHLGRSFATPYRAVTTTDTFTANDYTINATSGTFTVNLPTAVGITGRIYVLKNSGVGSITLDPAGAELIDGLATATAVAGASITTQSTGTAWIII